MFFNIYLESNNTFQVIKIDNSYIIKNNKDNIVSKLNYHEFNIKNFDWILLSDLETEPKYRGKGLATKLINSLCDDVFKNTDKGVYLFVKTDNYTAINLYNKLGFKAIKQYHLKDGNYIIMAKGNADMSQLDKMKFS